VYVFRCVDGIRFVPLVIFHRQHFEDAFHGRERTLEFGEGIHDVPNRVEQQEREPLERHDVADGRAAADVQVDAELSRAGFWVRRTSPRNASANAGVGIGWLWLKFASDRSENGIFIFAVDLQIYDCSHDGTK